MRPGQNKRMRGRSNNNNNNNSNRKGPNPLTRSYESNGPDVKIRGTAHHIGEKYLQLARDAQSSGDPVMAESYLQHAEHYFRLIASAQQAQQQAQFGYQRQSGDQSESDEDDGDEDFVSLPDRFASPSEKPVQAVQPTQQPYPDGAGDRAPDRQQDRQDRYDPSRSGPQNAERQPYGSRDRQFDNRRDRNNYQDRTGQDRTGQDRNNPDRGAQDRNGQDRNNQERGPYQDRNSYQDRNGPDRNAPARPDDRQPREFDNRSFRNRNRDVREGQPRDARPSMAEEPSNGLPAFITAPSRIQPENEPQSDAPDTNAPSIEASDDNGFHLRPRRRRRSKGDFADGDTGPGDGHNEAPASDPVGD